MSESTVSLKPPYALLAHIRAAKRKANTFVTRRQDSLDTTTNPEDAAACRKWINREQEHLAKWTAWESWVAAHIAKDAVEGDAG